MPTVRGWLILVLVMAVALANQSILADEAPSLLGWRTSSVGTKGKNLSQTAPGDAPASRGNTNSNGLQPVAAAPSLKPTPAGAHGPSTAVNGTTDPRPRALLIRNPNAETGDAPFALADNRGQVQRLVEPTVGVNLEDYLGQVVRVNHDTGVTLLASQLDLPSGTPPPRLAFDPAASPRGVARAQYQFAQYEPVQYQQGESLPEPIVLEEVTGVPEEPSASGLRFPSSLEPAPTVANGPIIGPPGAPPAATCVGCGAVVQGPYGYTACAPGCPLAGFHWPRLPLGNLDFSVDALWLRTHDSAGVNSNSKHDLGSRWELGFNPDWNRRLAIRYFEYDTNLTTGSMNVETLDLESQRWIMVGNARVGIGGGVRWADYREAGGLNYGDTIGPMLGVYARGPAIGTLDGLFHLRQSFQFGSAGDGQGQGTFGVTELQLGLEHSRCIRSGELFLRGLLETQYWNDVSQIGGTNSSRGMVGLGLGAGLRR